MDREIVKNEIQLLDNECCIVFDFGCYFPYSNFGVLTFAFSLGIKEFDDYKINHRYPNKKYQTISKKYGRKVSKIGYPYIMKLYEQSPMLLCLKVGINKQYITMIFPLQTNLTKEKPICELSLRYNFDKSEFDFMSRRNIWTNHEIKIERNGCNNVLLSTPQMVGDDSCTLIYENIIEPCPEVFSGFLL